MPSPPRASASASPPRKRVWSWACRRPASCWSSRTRKRKNCAYRCRSACSFRQGTRIVIDQNRPMTSPYAICLSEGCIAEYDATSNVINRLKKGKQLAVQAINANGQAIGINLPLADFAKVIDGPPTDTSAFEAAQQARAEDLRRRINEARELVERAQRQAGSQGGAQRDRRPDTAGCRQKRFWQRFLRSSSVAIESLCGSSRALRAVTVTIFENVERLPQPIALPPEICVDFHALPVGGKRRLRHCPQGLDLVQSTRWPIPDNC